jgi:hypothetical protein
MEIRAVCNWKISPFNDYLNKDQEDEDKKDYVFLIIPEDGSADSLIMTNTDSYIICSCPIDAIQAIFPQRPINFQVESGKIDKMLYNNIVVKDGESLKVVITTKTDNEYLPIEAKPITFGELVAGGFSYWAVKQGTNLANVNISISRDPETCDEKNRQQA